MSIVTRRVLLIGFVICLFIAAILAISASLRVQAAPSEHVITSCAQLSEIDSGTTRNEYIYILGNDIDCAGIDFDPLGDGGSQWTVFRSTFDGRGHTIRNLTIDVASGWAGLFSHAQNATIRNIHFEGGSVTTNGSFAGVLVGQAEGSIDVSNVTSNVSVTAEGGKSGGVIGGIFADEYSSVALNNVHVSGSISGPSSVGGLVGQMQISNDITTVSRSSFTGSITSTEAGEGAGGIIGYLQVPAGYGPASVVVQDTYSSGNIDFVYCAGGIIGIAQVSGGGGESTAQISLRRVYSSGDINVSGQFGGGLIGYALSQDTAEEIILIHNSFAAGAISGSTTYGIMHAENGAVAPDLFDVYFDATRAGTSEAANIELFGISSVNNDGTDLDYFINNNMNPPLDTWNFPAIWSAHPGLFPTLTAPLYGDGSDGDPYRIHSCGDFMAIRNDLYAHYILMNDINCSADGGEITIGNDIDAFRGALDGNDKKITIDINETKWPHDVAGLFNYLDGIVHDLEIHGSIISDASTGALAGYAEYSTIDNVHSYATVQGGSKTGGLIGETSNSNITSVSVTADVSGSDNLGGVIGWQSNTNMSNASYKGNVSSSDSFVGGIIGNNLNSNLSRSASSGTVSGLSIVGGLMGMGESQSANTVRTSYSTSNVSAIFISAGGIAGQLGGDFVVEDCYSRGDVTAESEVGGIAGTSYGNLILHAYATGVISATDGTFEGGILGREQNQSSTLIEAIWDSRNGENPDTTAGTNTVGLIGAQSAADMKVYLLYSTHPDLSEPWNFESVWGMNGTDNDGYPFLQWQGWVNDPPRDYDAIPNAVENAAPNNGDANKDGTPDAEQNNVASIINTITNTYVTVVLDDNYDCDFSAPTINSMVTVAPEDSYAVKDAGFSYPGGFVNFTAQCAVPGTSVPVQVYFYGLDVNAPVGRKHNPNTHAYFTIPGSTLTQDTIDEQQVHILTYEIKDGGILDIDGLENSVIVDPAGLGIVDGAAVGAPNTGVASVAEWLYKK